MTDGSVTSDFIANAAIGSAHIQNAAINSANIADAAITSAKIAEAAVGTAAIQNAAITKAHLKTAIIDTAHIIDGAITNAKIGSLSADKITSGTIKAIDITGSLIKGGRFEPLNESSAYKSYIEANKIYQRFDYRSSSTIISERYDEMTITSGQISMVTGSRETGTDVPLRYLKLSDASVNMSGNTTQKDYSEIQMYCNDWDALKGSESSAWLRMKRGGATTMYMGSFVPEASANKVFTFNTMGSDTFQHVDQVHNVFAEKNIMLRAKTGIDIEVVGGSGPITFTPGGENAVRMRVGNSPGTPHVPLLGIEVDQSIVKTHGALNTNAIVRLYEQEVTMPTTGNAYTGVAFDFLMLDIKSLENVFLILPTVYGAYADHVHVKVISQSSTSAARLWIRGIGDSTVILGKTFKVRLAVFVEPQ